ncbi:MAG: hypothetical protein ACR9NN_23570 [Nostochopsis sp.]
MTTQAHKSNLFNPPEGKLDVNDQLIKEGRVKNNTCTGLYMESFKWAKGEKTLSPRYRFTCTREQISQMKKTWYIFPLAL